MTPFIDTSILEIRNNEAKVEIQNVIKQFSCTNVNISSTSYVNNSYCSIILEAYFNTHTENNHVVSLSIDFNAMEEYIDSNFSIYKESGEFILSPREFIIKNGIIPKEFMNLLDEYYNVFGLLIKNFILNEDDFIKLYG